MMPTAMQHLALVIFGLLLYVVITYATGQRRNPSVAAAWVTGIAAFPYLGIPIFLLFGVRKYRAPAAALPLPATPTPDAPAWTVRLLCGIGIDPPLANPNITFHADGAQAYADLMATLESATHSLELATYVLGEDETGHAVIDALLAAAARGVQVRVLVDAVGSWRLSRRSLRRMRVGRIHVHRFMPFLHNPTRGKSNLRNHRKLVVADARRLWSGGRNLADEYFFNKPGRPAWTDMSFSLEGPVAAQARACFEQDWVATVRAGSPEAQAWPAPPALPFAAAPAQGIAQWVPSGPDQPEDSIHALLLAAVYRASDHIDAITPYFVPDEALLNALCMASRAGTRVRLLVPARSNHRFTDLARERALRQLSAAGAQILLAPGMTHAKLVIIDQQIALCGSANLDGRSLFLNYEVMTAFYSPREIAWLTEWADGQFDSAQRYQRHPPAWWVDLAEGIARSVGVQL
mgnify:FL=1